MEFFIRIIVFAWKNPKIVWEQVLICIWTPWYRLYLLFLSVGIGMPMDPEMLARVRILDSAINQNLWRSITQHLQSNKGLAYAFYGIVTSIGLDKALFVALCQALLSYFCGEGFSIPLDSFANTPLSQIGDNPLFNPELQSHSSLPHQNLELNESEHSTSKSQAILQVIIATTLILSIVTVYTIGSSLK
jgi:hypothetical protein